MNRAEKGPEPPRDGPKNVSEHSTTIALQENDVLNPSRRSKRLHKESLLQNKNGDNMLPPSEGLSNGNIVDNVNRTNITNPSEKSCSQNAQCESSEYLFGLYDQEMDLSHSSNHKFYGCKRKGYPSPCSESFGLPDDPIFSNSPLFLDRPRQSPLDVDVADSSDICVLDLEYVDQPWLVEYPEVITPYWDVESLFPFVLEDIRHKMEPDLLKNKNLSDSFNISGSMLDVSVDNESGSDNVFTSTPVKNQNNSLSVVSTINITGGDESNVNIDVLKDEVLKALEEAIKKKTSIGNIDMKIQIVTSDLKNPITSPKKYSVGVKANENIEIESCTSSASSKENYFSNNTTEKSKNMSKTKELSKVTLSNLTTDWEDSPGSDLNDQSQDELKEFNNIMVSSTKTAKKSIRKKKNVPGVRRSLRTRDANMSTTNDKETLANISGQLSFGDPVIYTPSKTSKLLGTTKSSVSQLDNIFISNEVSLEVSEHPLENDSINTDDSQSDSRRILRSSYSHKDISQIVTNVNKNVKQFKNIDLLPVPGKDEHSAYMGKQKLNGRLANDRLQVSPDQNGVGFADRSRRGRKSRLAAEDSQSSQDESDNIEAIGMNRLRLRSTQRNKELQFSQDQVNVDKKSIEKSNRSESLKHIDFQTRDYVGEIAEQSQQGEETTSKSTSTKTYCPVDIQSKRDETNRASREKSKKNKLLLQENILSSQDEGNTNKTKQEMRRSKKKERSGNNYSQSSDNDTDIGKNVVEDSNKDTLQPNQSQPSNNKCFGRKEIDDLLSSQDQCDISKDDLVQKRKKGRPMKVKVLQENLNDGSINANCSMEKTNKSSQNAVDSAKNQDEHDISSFKRILRSSAQHLKPDVDIIKEGRRRTFSTSASEISPKEQNNTFLARKRSVSVNFGSKAAHSTPLRRSLRSQAAESAKVPETVKSPEHASIKDSTRLFENHMKSPKITFNLKSQFRETPKTYENDSPVKSILKNVYDSAGRLIGVKLHREKHVKMPSTLEIKPENKDDKDMVIKEGATCQIIPTELELNSIKKEEEECLRENGITSQIKIVISPLEIKEEVEDSKVPPASPVTVPQTGIPPLRKSGRISNITSQQESTSEDTSESIAKSGSDIPGETNAGSVETSKKTNDKINVVVEKAIPVEVKEIKIEEPNYNLGNFVWAQVSKYPFWPAIVCEDPVTQTFQKEILRYNKLPQVSYHLRFFGDYGRRAWVHRKHIMLYCSNQDLEEVSKKLKSENKNINIVRPYLVTGSSQVVEKWHNAVEELNLLKNKKYDNIIKHMLDSYGAYLMNRRKRKLQMLDASSESESEEPDTCETRAQKKFKVSEHSHVTADAQLVDYSASQNKDSEGFDEISITIGTNSTAVSSTPLEKTSEDSSENATVVNEASHKGRKSTRGPEVLTSTSTVLVNAQSLNDTEIGSETMQISEISDKVTPRRSRRSLKPVESFHISAESLDRNLETVIANTEVPEISETQSESSVRLGERRSLRAIKSSSSNEISAGPSEESERVLTRLGKNQPDERSEAESKSSSDGRSSDSNIYSFEYQMDLHKKNYLFNGLTRVRVCDYCHKQGDLYKCKGRCGGYFHLDCASKVTHPIAQKRAKKREKSPSKAKVRGATSSVETTPKSERTEEKCRTRNQCQVQIITIKSKHAIGTPKKVNLPANFDELSLSEQIDYGMKEMMSKFENRTIYGDSTDSSSEEGSIIASKGKQPEIMDSPASSGVVESEKSATKSSDIEEHGEEEKSSDDLEASVLSDNAEKAEKLIKHVTADSVILTEGDMDITNLKCTYCRMELDPPCFACGLEISKRGSSIRQKCSQYRCGRYYHPHCLKMWPQAQWSIGKWSRNQEQEDSFTCPAHTCHTCFSEELGSTACRLPGDKLARCMLCPAGFHTTTFCIPAGTVILGGSQIVCPRHRSKPIQPINTIWCFICSEGGNLICCDTCPTSVHPECQPINLTDDDKYICEDCESGRFPLYDEIVWVKLGHYRWWPALVLFPNEIPENVKALKHQRGDFAVRFFGTNDHYWVNKARSFLFQEGDRGGSPGEANKSKNKVYESFGKAIEDAALAYKLKKEYKLRREAESINSLKPPTYVRINKNKPVGNVKSQELDLSNAPACECDPNKPHPCGPDGNCINRLLMTECDPDVCPAGSRCRNQSFQKRDYPPLIPYKTQGRGWGLKCLAPIKKGQFVIEYVGDLIDSEEYQRRIQKMHEQKEENYYFMTVDCDRMIDAGPKGNLSRFMNHCCNPNCITQKWTVRGDTRVGLFANCDIESGAELTFNYNLEVVGQEKKVCKCEAGNCSGFIGVKAKTDKLEKPQTDTVSEAAEQRRPRKYNKKRVISPPSIPPCFMCSRKQSDLTCNNKFCNKGYHLKCLKLNDMPEVVKFTCPRHNCNICSNRTIRCCVKCTNSFCPSHSEGNVRHDKFLGFVCRLHDPGISSTDITSQSIDEQRKSTHVSLNNRKSRHKSINSYPPEKRELIRAAWRVYKRRQYARNKIMKLTRAANKRKRSSKGKKSKITDLEQNSKALARNPKENGKNVPLTKQNMIEKSTILSSSIAKYRLRVKKGRRVLELPKQEKETVQRVNRLKQRAELLKKERNPEVQVSMAGAPVQEKVQENDLAHAQVNDVISTVQNHLLNDHDTTNVAIKILEPVQDSRPEHVKDNDTADDDGTELNIQNNLVTSEHPDDTVDISDVTQSERSEFEPLKSTKRRRQKPDVTDESAVSSTTSEEYSHSKAPPLPQTLNEIEPANDEYNNLEGEDSVSSTPPKEPVPIPDSKALQEEDGAGDTSEDELTLDQRAKSRMGMRNPRKKIRVNVKGLVNTAKTP